MSDVAPFLARLTRLDPATLVRVRVRSGTGVLWARVPWDVLVTRTASGGDLAGGEPAGFGPDDDRTVRAADWLAAGTLDGLARYDADWRGALPSGPVTTLESLPAEVLRQLDAAAARTLRETGETGIAGRAVGARAVRDALLDHVPITVTTADGTEVGIPQRLVQAVLRMGFHGDAGAEVRVVAAGGVRPGGFLGLVATYGTAWWRRPGGLAVRPAR